MQLIRFGPAGQERPGIHHDGKHYDASKVVVDYDTDFFDDDRKLKAIATARDAGELPELPPDTRLGPPLARPGKLLCIGLNYRRHAEESGMDIPKEPVLFMKATSAICGPYDDVELPHGSEKLDWEVELAIVIARRAKYVDEDRAMDHVFGYCIHNDVSERSFQLERGGQWVKGKSHDTFAPLGPWLVTKDKITDPHDLHLWLKLNGKTVQDDSTNDLIFGIPAVVSYVSRFMTLEPGDVISTGTPMGVGLGMSPPRYLSAGDTVELGIDGLGSAKQTIVAPASAPK